MLTRAALTAITLPWARLGAFVLSGGLCLAVLPVLAALLLGGRPPQPWPMLAALAPVAVLVAAVATLIAGSAAAAGAGGPSRWVVAVPGLLFAVLLGWQAVPLLRTPDPVTGPGAAAGVPGATGVTGTAGVGLRVLTVNAWNGDAEAAAVVDQVRRRRVDVLTVQELTPQLVDRLAAAGLDGELPHRVLRPAPGFRGTGLWSRWPLTELPDVAGMTAAAPRAVLHPPTGPALTVLAVHPNAPLDRAGADAWARDLDLLATAYREAAGPAGTPGRVVLAGDFNATRDHAPFRDLLAVGLRDALDAAPGGPRPAYTYPAGRPFPALMRLDHVLFSPAGLRCRSAATVPVRGSDHHGVIATLDLS